jgi:hypothetical protein
VWSKYYLIMICMLSAYTCSQSFSTGNVCGPTVTRWYYDSTNRACQTFTYNGCDGNSNNFATQQDCKEFCRVDSCPDGGSLYTDLSGVARVCSIDNDCPSTHFCTSVSTYSTQRGYAVNSYCCPTKSTSTLLQCTPYTLQHIFAHNSKTKAPDARRRRYHDSGSTVRRVLANNSRITDVRAIVTILPPGHNAPTIVCRAVGVYTPPVHNISCYVQRVHLVKWLDRTRTPVRSLHARLSVLSARPVVAARTATHVTTVNCLVRTCAAVPVDVMVCCRFVSAQRKW